MTDDLLERATRALRERHEGRSDEAEATRTRVLEQVGGRGAALEAKRADRGRSRPASWVVLLAATMAVATAWGASKAPLRALLSRGEAPSLESARAPGRPASVAPPPADPPPAAPAVTVTLPGTSDAAPEPAAAIPRSVAPAYDLGHDADALYERGHRLQVAGDDLAGAVTAWDAYLSRAPNGTYCLEARYDRAMDLARLGRSSQARAALEPFARGDYGSYRQADARALLITLGTPP